MQRIGLIGIGNIGSHFTRLLCDASYPVVALDIDRAKVETAVALGAVAAASPAEVAEKTDIVLLCLPGSQAVEAVMEGAVGLLDHLRAGHLIVDTGTTHPKTDIHYEKRCAEKGAGLVDAPITWRAKGLIVMVGGSAENYAKAKPVLSLLSYKLRHIGPIGNGQLLKLANQLVLAGQIAVYAEAIAWAQEVGVDPRLLRDYLEFDIDDTFFGDDFSGGGALALHYKDLGYVLDMAHHACAQIPVTNAVHEAFKAVKSAGDPGWQQTGIVTYWRRLNQEQHL